LKPLRLAALAASLAVLAGCSGGRASEPDGLQLSADARADYYLFAMRCSKCHSLARPLSSGIDDDEYWKRYVAKMRRQPGSGISAEDTVAILRFLHIYAQDQRRRKGKSLDAPSPPPPDLDASPPTGAP
jgi:hypothetical protein